MALYADTCILLPLFFRDANTDAALAWLEASGSETILISPDPLPASKMQLRWQGQSGDWHVSGYGGFLANSDIQGLGGNVFLAGRCPTSIEVF